MYCQAGNRSNGDGIFREIQNLNIVGADLAASERGYNIFADIKPGGIYVCPIDDVGYF